MKMYNVKTKAQINIIRHLLLDGGWSVYISDQLEQKPSMGKDTLTLAVVVNRKNQGNLGYIPLELYQERSIYDTNIDSDIQPPKGWCWKS